MVYPADTPVIPLCIPAYKHVHTVALDGTPAPHARMSMPTLGTTSSLVVKFSAHLPLIGRVLAAGHVIVT